MDHYPAIWGSGDKSQHFLDPSNQNEQYYTPLVSKYEIWSKENIVGQMQCHKDDNLKVDGALGRRSPKNVKYKELSQNV